MRSPIGTSLLLCLIVHPAVSACTIFMITAGDRVLVGNNEDWTDPYGKIRFVPASEGGYGRVYFGNSNMGPQRGMNDQGFFFGYAATKPLTVTGSSQKPMYGGTSWSRS